MDLLRAKRPAPEVRRQIELTTLLDSMPEGVLIVDIDGMILDANTSSERFLRCSRDGLRGCSLLELAAELQVEVKGEPLDFPQYAVTRALRGESVRNERRTLRGKDGGENIDAIVSAHPIYEQRDGKRTVIGAFV